MTRNTQQQIRYTLATHTIEHMIPSQNAIRLCEQLSDGSISADAAVAATLQRYGLKKASTHE